MKSRDPRGGGACTRGPYSFPGHTLRSLPGQGAGRGPGGAQLSPLDTKVAGVQGMPERTGPQRVSPGWAEAARDPRGRTHKGGYAQDGRSHLRGPERAVARAPTGREQPPRPRAQPGNAGKPQDHNAAGRHSPALPGQSTAPAPSDGSQK